MFTTHYIEIQLNASLDSAPKPGCNPCDISLQPADSDMGKHEVRHVSLFAMMQFQLSLERHSVKLCLQRSGICRTIRVNPGFLRLLRQFLQISILGDSGVLVLAC